MIENNIFNREGEHLFISAPVDFYTAKIFIRQQMEEV